MLPEANKEIGWWTLICDFALHSYNVRVKIGVKYVILSNVAFSVDIFFF